jgi:hypothetical protein
MREPGQMPAVSEPGEIQARDSVDAGLSRCHHSPLVRRRTLATFAQRKLAPDPAFPQDQGPAWENLDQMS